jgi:hypothetical protein
MKIEPLQPNHGPMIAKFALSQGLYFGGNIHYSSKDEFFKIWWCFHDMQIEGETEKILGKFVLSFKAHKKKVIASISGYEQGTAQFSECWECLGWAIAWYYLNKDF